MTNRHSGVSGRPGAWKEVALCLQDGELREIAVRAIIAGRQFQFWPQTLREDARVADEDWPFGKAMTEALGTLRDDELKALLARNDRYVDLVCLQQIRKDCRFLFLDEVLRLLNENRSHGARRALDELLTGPDPFHSKDDKSVSTRDPLTWLLQKPTGTAEERSLTRSGKRAYKIEQEVAALARKPSPENWVRLVKLTERWQAEGGAEWWFAAFVQAMHACDAARTRDWLTSRLRDTVKDEARAVPILCAIGAIPEPTLLASVEEFGINSQIKTNGNPYYRVPFE